LLACCSPLFHPFGIPHVVIVSLLSIHSVWGLLHFESHSVSNSKDDIASALMFCVQTGKLFYEFASNLCRWRAVQGSLCKALPACMSNSQFWMTPKTCDRLLSLLFQCNVSLG
jgi:hypothetical protein